MLLQRSWKNFVVLFLTANLIICELPVYAFETLGAIFEFDASQDDPGDAVWTETGLLGNETLTFVSGTPTATQVSDGTLNLFSHNTGADGASGVYEAVLGGVGQASRRDATFEIWFKPNDLTTADQIIFETGGAGRGTIISLDNNSLEFLVNGDNSITLSDTLANNNWHQVVGVINNVANDNVANEFIQLYVNGAIVGTSAPLEIDDWSGGNQGGLGSYGGATHPIDGQIAGDSNGVDFNGNIHLNRYYDRALTATEITANYNNVVNPGPAWNVDADGTWNNSSNWSTGSVPGGGGDAILGPVATASRTVTLDVNTNLGGLALNNSNGYTIADGGATLTLSGSAELRATSGSHEIAAPIAGIAPVKTGGGTVSLSGTNTFTGTIDLSGGTLAVSDNTNLGNAANGIEFNGATLRVDGTSLNTLPRSLTMTANGTLNVADASNTVDVTGAVTGSGTLVKAGDGAAKLSNAATYDGQIDVNAGTLVVSDNNGLGTTTGVTKIDSDGGTVELDGSGGALTIAENFQNLNARFNGVPEAHIRNTAGNNTLTGTVQAGGGAFGNARFENTANGSTLTIDNTISHVTEDINFNMVFEGTGNFQVGDASTPNSGKIVGNNVNVIVDLDDPTDTVTIATAFASLDTSNASGEFWGGNTNIESGTLEILTDGANDDGELASASINVKSGATFDVSDFDNGSGYSLQVVEDPDAIPFNGDEVGQTLTGAGTIVTSSNGINAFEDAVIEPGDSIGTLNVTGNMRIFQSQANANGALNYELGSSNTIGGGVNDLLAVSGTLDLDADAAAGGGQFKLNITVSDGDLDSSGAYTIMSRGSAGTSTATAADFDVTLSNPQGNALNTRQDDAITVSVNPASVTVSFSASESSNWTGAINGNWDTNGTNNWSSSDNKFFDLDNVSFGDGTGQTSVNIANAVSPGSVTFNNTVDSYTFTGSGIEGSSSLNLNAGSNVTLANNTNTYTGGTNIAAGATLNLGNGTNNAANLGQLTAGSTVANEGTLSYNRSGYNFNTHVISGTGTVEVNAGGFVDMNGVSTYSGTTIINDGTMRIRNPSGAGTGAVVVNNGSNFETGYFGNQAISKSVTLNDGSELSHTDPEDNFLSAENSGNLTWTDPITLGGTGGIVSTTAGDGIVPGMTVAGGITGTGDLTLRADTDRLLVVNSPLTHSGNTSIDGEGTVALQATAAPSSSQIELNNTATLDVTGLAGSTLALSSQTFIGASQVNGNITTASNSTIRVGGVASGLPSVTTGLQLNYDASLDESGDGDWDDSEPNLGDADLDFTGGPASTIAVNDPTFTALTAAYDISSTGAATSLGSDNGYFDFRGQSSGTFELVFNVTNTSAGNEQVLMDIGGGVGVAVTLDGSTLTAGVNGTDDVDTTSFNTTLSNGWHHAVVVIEENDPSGGSDDVFTLYVDNVAVGSSSTVGIDDYAGANGWSFGGPNSVTLDPTQLASGAATLGSAIDFHGQIAIARYYQTAFSSGDVDANYLALQAGPFIDVETLSIDGDLTLDSTATLELDIFDSIVGNDLVDVSGALTAAGTLDISLAGTVSLGETFDIFDFASFSGSFNTINLPTLGSGLAWDTSNLGTTGVLEVVSGFDPADLNMDGFVDGLDLGILLGSWNTVTTPANGELNGTPPVDGLDLGILLGSWNPPPAAATAAVPEPASAVLVIFGLLGLASSRRRS